MVSIEDNVAGRVAAHQNPVALKHSEAHGTEPTDGQSVHFCRQAEYWEPFGSMSELALAPTYAPKPALN